MRPVISVLSELRSAARLMVRRPGFTLAAAGILAFGMGATTAIFTVFNGVLLEPLDYEDPDRLVYVWDRLDWVGVPRAWVAGPEVASLQRDALTFEELAGIRVESRNLVGEGPPERVALMLSSANIFDVLGVEPALGRSFTAADEGPAAEQVALLSHSFWQRRFGGGSDVVGRRVQLDDESYTILGVMPADFEFVKPPIMDSPEDPALYTTFPYALAELNPDAHSFAVVGRIKPGVTFGEARAELVSLSRRLDEERYGNRGFLFEAVRLHDSLVAEVRPYLLLLLGAVGFVLIIVCANLATLFLSKSVARGRELAVRRALGAGAGTIVRQLLSESVVIAILGGAGGLVLAYWLQDALLALAPAELPRREDIGIDLTVIAFNLGLALLAGLIVGLGPALRGVARPPGEALADAGRGGSPGPRAWRARSALVSFQIAVSVVLLAGTGLLLRSFVGLTRVDPGFDADAALTARVVLPAAEYSEPQDRLAFFEQVTRRLEGVPGIISAAATRALPMSASASQDTYSFEGSETATGDPDEERVLLDVIPVTPGYFRAGGIRLLEGRGFNEADRADAPPVAIIDRTLAERFWPTRGAVGKTVLWNDEEIRIVGVVEHARMYEVHRDDRGQIYHPHAQLPVRDMFLIARVEGAPLSFADPMRRSILEVDPNQPAYAVRTLDSYVAESLATRRFSLLLVGFFAAAALFLAGFGVFAIVSYAVTARTREIGLRVALGARPDKVVILVLRRGMVPVILGAFLGLAVALALGRLISGLLVGVGARDPLTLAAATFLLGAIALAAAYVPARRAASIDPMEAIRYE